MNEQEKATIIEVLCSQALADHLGDVRNAEDKLWSLLGAPDLSYSDDEWDDNSAWSYTQARLEKAGLPLPEYLRD